MWKRMLVVLVGCLLVVACGSDGDGGGGGQSTDAGVDSNGHSDPDGADKPDGTDEPDGSGPDGGEHEGDWIAHQAPEQALDDRVVFADGAASGMWLAGNYDSVLHFDGSTWTEWSSEALNLERDETIYYTRRAVMVDARGWTWLATDRSAMRYEDGVWQTWEDYDINDFHDYRQPGGDVEDAAPPYVHPLKLAFLDANKNPWFIPKSNGAQFTNEYSAWFYTHDGSGWTLFGEESGAPYHHPEHATATADGVIWMGSHGRGLWSVNPSTAESAIYDFAELMGDQGYVAPTDGGTFPDAVRTMVADAAGNLWIASTCEGSDEDARCEGIVRRDASGNWTFYENENFGNFDSDYEGLPPRHIQKLVVDGRGYVWVASAFGFAYFDGESWKAFVPETPFEMNNHWETNWTVDADGHLWVFHPGDYSDSGVIWQSAKPAPF